METETNNQRSYQVYTQVKSHPQPVTVRQSSYGDWLAPVRPADRQNLFAAAGVYQVAAGQLDVIAEALEYWGFELVIELSTAVEAA